MNDSQKTTVAFFGGTANLYWTALVFMSLARGGSITINDSFLITASVFMIWVGFVLMTAIAVHQIILFFRDREKFRQFNTNKGDFIFANLLLVIMHGLAGYMWMSFVIALLYTSVFYLRHYWIEVKK